MLISKCQAASKLIFLVVIVLPIAAVAVAAVSAGILYTAEGWTYEDCLWQILGELIGSTVPMTQDESADGPDTTIGRTVWILVSLISIGCYGAILGMMVGPLMEPYEVLVKSSWVRSMSCCGRKSDKNPSDMTLGTAMGKIAGIMFLVVPVSAAIIASVFGGVLYHIEGWTYEDTVWQLLGELVGSTIPLTQNESANGPESTLARIMWVVVCMFSITLLGLVFATMAGPLLGPFYQLLKRNWVGKLKLDEHGRETHMSRATALLKLLMFLLFIIPSAAAVISLVVAAALFRIEGWPYEETFWIVIGEMIGTTIPLLQHDEAESGPTSNLGRAMWIVMSLFSLSLFALVLALMGGPLIEPFNDLLIRPWFSKSNHTHLTKRMALLKLAMIVFIFIPILAAAIGAVCAAIIYKIEEWTYEDALWQVMGQLIGTTIAMTQNDSANGPTSLHGRIGWVLVSMISIGFFGLVVAIMIGPLFDPFYESWKSSWKAKMRAKRIFPSKEEVLDTIPDNSGRRVSMTLRRSGTSEAIGASFDFQHGFHRVVNVERGGLAHEAGLRRNDVFVAIGKITTWGLNRAQFLSLLSDFSNKPTVRITVKRFQESELQILDAQQNESNNKETSTDQQQDLYI